jgi:hypothetical protein
MSDCITVVDLFQVMFIWYIYTTGVLSCHFPFLVTCPIFAIQSFYLYFLCNVIALISYSFVILSIPFTLPNLYLHGRAGVGQATPNSY